VIVDCESCRTRFRLDDSRIPPTGARVRCSRCKTAFVVYRPDTTVNEVVEQVVGEVTQPRAPRAPAPTSDLFESTGSVIGEAAAASTPPAEATGGDEQWEFDEAPPRSRKPEVAPPPARPASQSAAPPEPRDDEVLPSLGAPSDWDLLGSSSDRVAEEISFQPAPAEARRATGEEASTPMPGGFAPDPIEAAVQRASAAEGAGERESSGLRAALASAVDFFVVGSSWIAAAALCLLGVALAVQPRAWPQSDGAASVMTAQIGGVSHEVTLRRLESAVAGNLIVVSGQLPPNAGALGSTRLRAAWLDASGAPLEAPGAVAGPPMAKRKLREHSLARIAGDYDARAGELTAGGPYEAVFAALPEGAASLSLVREPIPVQAAPEPALASADAGARDAAAPETSEATASRPSARPSSE
jgi:predicted Zn finger-like uncharacterized protein